MAYQIAVIGAGIGGLCAALALRQRGHQVRVYEQSSVISEVGAGLQLSPNAMYILQQLGVDQALLAQGFLPQTAKMRHFRSGKAYFSVPLATSQRYDAPYVHIHRADLQQTLLATCQQQGVELELGMALVDYQHIDTGVSLNFTDGSAASAQLVIGADGIKSKVQACMLGPTPARFTGQVAWRGVVDASLLPKGLIQPDANLWVGPQQHFVSYYLRGGRLVNFVAVEEQSHWQDESWQQAGDVEVLRDKFSGWHPEVSELLQHAEQTFLWALFDRAPLAQWVDGQVALLGDACHPMLPFLAQGAAMAIEDSWVLANALDSQQGIVQSLQLYQAQRMPRTAMIQTKARENAKLYHMSGALERNKLRAMAGLAKLNLSDAIATRMLDSIYGYRV